MWSLPRFLSLLAAFVVAVGGVVWFTAGAERDGAVRTFAEVAAADDVVRVMTERESAMRSYLQTSRDDQLPAYEASRDALGRALGLSRKLAGGNATKRELLTQQEQLAERWTASADDAIVRVRAQLAVPGVTVIERSQLMTQLRGSNDLLKASIAATGQTAHEQARQNAVLLVLLVAALFGGLGWMLVRHARALDERRHREESDYNSTQQEFAQTMQITRDEPEAHALVKHHLERSIPRSTVVVLNRNNSQNRLEATTPVDSASPLGARLAAATPQSCLATRLGRKHEHSLERVPLLSCELCGTVDRATCVPSLVGGEVIGSVLVEHESELHGRQRARIDESVAQAAPVLANLRNLAIAEVQAATDALTGLPNARSLRDNLKRMLAQAVRSEQPLSAILCDLDHFKQINDVYGHGKGDDALAAAATTMRRAIRAADLAGRYGGEEFLILLPDTSLEGALVLAEKLRDEIDRTEVKGVAQGITASFGVAAFPADAPDADTLVRMADRSLYAAKARGRNCVVAATELLPEPVSP